MRGSKGWPHCSGERLLKKMHIRAVNRTKSHTHQSEQSPYSVAVASTVYGYMWYLRNRFSRKQRGLELVLCFLGVRKKCRLKVSENGISNRGWKKLLVYFTIKHFAMYYYGYQNRTD